ASGILPAASGNCIEGGIPQGQHPQQTLYSCFDSHAQNTYILHSVCIPFEELRVTPSDALSSAALVGVLSSFMRLAC
ncbi:unnamed protein product, partial [Ceratitis capitata]